MPAPKASTPVVIIVAGAVAGLFSTVVVVVVVAGAVAAAGGRRVGGLRVVLRHVDDFRLRRLEHDDFLALLLLGLDLHRLGGLQVADVDRLLAQTLHGIEHAGLVGDERLAQFGGPAHFHAHHVDGLRELHQRANRRRETGLRRAVVQRLALEAFVRDEPVAGVEHFLRIGRGDQHLRQHRIGVQRERARAGPRAPRASRSRWPLRPPSPGSARARGAAAAAGCGCGRRAGARPWLQVVLSSRSRRARWRRQTRARSPGNGDPRARIFIESSPAGARVLC